MPFGVTQWGYSPDPRPPDFCPIGFNFGQIPPFQWVSKTTGADAPFTALNSDFLWKSVLSSANSCQWRPVVLLPGLFHQDIRVDGTELPAGGPPTFTSDWHVEFGPFFGPRISEGFLRETYLDAIGVRSFTMSGSGTGGPLFPNPLVFTPAKWNFVLP